MFGTRSRDPTLYEAVNKRLPSTGESRELVHKNLGACLNPGVEYATPRIMVSNRRERAGRKNLRNVADTAETGDRRCCQDNGRGNLARGRCGFPGGIRTGRASDVCGGLREPWNGCRHTRCSHQQTALAPPADGSCAPEAARGVTPPACNSGGVIIQLPFSRSNGRQRHQPD